MKVLYGLQLREKLLIIFISIHFSVFSRISRDDEIFIYMLYISLHKT